MNFDMNDIRSRLAPAWSGVNIALVVVLFLVAWPLGLLMIGYILWGRNLGLDLGRPQTFSRAFDRLGAAVQAGLDEFRSGARPADPEPDSPPSDPTEFARWREEQISQLDARRRELDEERARGRTTRDS